VVWNHIKEVSEDDAEDKRFCKERGDCVYS
jgi:hypothetical protein